MRILPVLDLKGGVVVRGVAGQRETYRPIQSILSPDARPAQVARGLVTCFGFRQAYVADLDAIGGAEPDWSALRAIAGEGLRLWVDAGVSGPHRAAQLMEFDAAADVLSAIIVGLESVRDPQSLAAIHRYIGAQKAVFSVDLKQGRPLVRPSSSWRGMSAVEIALAAVEVGFRRLIVLDLARVGVGQGTGVESLCAQLHRGLPEVELLAGGGVCGLADLRELAGAGCRMALVASALHDGRLTADDLQRIAEL